MGSEAIHTNCTEGVRTILTAKAKTETESLTLFCMDSPGLPNHGNVLSYVLICITMPGDC